MPHSKFPRTTHPHTPTAVFDGDGRRIIDQWRTPEDGLMTLEENCWDLRCIDIPTGSDDADTGWNIVEHHMSDPKERVIGTGRSPEEALKSATSMLKRADRYPRPTPLDPDTAAANAVMIAGLPGLIEALEKMVSAVETGNMFERSDERNRLRFALIASRKVLASIGRTL